MKDSFLVNTGYILDLLSEIDKIIAENIEMFRKNPKNNDFLGLHISEEEVDSLLVPESHSEKIVMREDVAKIIEKAKVKHSETCLELRLEKIREMFNLAPLEVFAILIVLARELDLKYSKLFAYLQDDVSKTKVSVGLVLNLFCKSKIEKIYSRRYFYDSSPLMKNSIIFIEDKDEPLIEKTLRMNEQFLRFILGEDDINIKNLVASE